MRIGRIARPGALYDASASSRDFGTIDETPINPNDFEEVIDVYVANVIGANSYSHMPCYEGPDR